MTLKELFLTIEGYSEKESERFDHISYFTRLICYFSGNSGKKSSEELWPVESMDKASLAAKIDRLKHFEKMREKKNGLNP